MDLLAGTLTNFIVQHFLVGLVWLAGAILALARRQTAPRTSRLLLAAIAILAFESLAAVCATTYLPLNLRSVGWSVGQIGLLSAGAGLIGSLLRAAAWILVLVAVFGPRNSD